MKVGVATIKEMIDSGQERDFAAYLYLKSFTRKARFFNYTQTHISLVSGLSRSSADKYVKKFIKNGWCVLYGKRGGKKHLMFGLGENDERGRFNQRIEIETKSIKNILKQFYLTLVKQKIAQFDKIKQANRELRTPKNKKSLKAAMTFEKKHFKKSSYAVKPSDLFTISYQGLGKLFNCSAPKAHKVMKEMEGLMIYRENHFVMKTNDPYVVVDFMSRNDGYYYKKGCIYKNKSNKYEFAA